MDVAILSTSLQPFSTSVGQKKKSIVNEIKDTLASPLRRALGIYAYLIKPVYNVGDYGEDVVIPLDQDNLTYTSITWASSTFARTTEDVAGITTFPMDDHTTLASDKTTGGIANEGLNTQFDRIYSWRPDMDAVCYKIDFSMAFGLLVTNYAANNFKITSVRCKMFVVEANANQRVLSDITWQSGLGNLAANGSQVFLVKEDVLADIELYSGFPILIQITMTCGTGTGDRNEGILPWFPSQAADLVKSFARSEIRMHLHAAVSHADKVLRRQQNEQKLDYSGMNVRGMNNNEPLPVEEVESIPVDRMATS